MKRLLVITVASVLALNVQAQSVQEGEKMIHYGRFESAKKILSPLADKDPQANYYLGIAELELENKQEAKNTFSRYADDFYNQAGMARVLLEEGKKEEANKLLQTITDKARKKDWERYKVAADALTYTEGGNISEAITWYQKALAINDNAATHIGLGDAFLKTQGGGGDAMSNYEKAVESGTNNSLAYSKIGSLWYAARKYDDALKNYGFAKDADPANPLPYRDLAYAYYRAGKYDNALTNIKEYLNLSDKSTDDQIIYADLLFLSKKYPEAKEKMQELITKGIEKPYMYRIIAYSAYETKDYPTALKNMHVFYTKQKDQSKIINEDYVYSGKIMSALAGQDSSMAKAYNDSADYYFNKAVASDTAKDKSELYRQIGEGFKDNREYAKAGYWYGKIIADNPDAIALDYFYWGYWNFYGRNYNEAAKAFKTMRAKYPNEGSALLWEAKVAAAIDNEAKTGGAASLYKEWLSFQFDGYEKKEADLMGAYQYLAFYYYNTENQSEAMVYVNKILEKEPNNEFANQVKDYYQKLKASNGSRK